jgi:hypothetical protein
VRVRAALLSIEAKLVGVSLLSICVLSPVVPLALLYCAIYFSTFHLVSSGLYAAMAGVGVILLLMAIWQRWRLNANELAEAEPLRESLDGWPELQTEVKAVASQAGVPAATTVRLTLGPLPSTPPVEVLKQIVRSEPGEIVLPAACLHLWSVFELRGHLARSMARCHTPRWLLSWFHRLMKYLGAEHYQMVTQGIESRRTRWIEQLLERYNALLARWQLLRDCYADRTAASAYGPELVASWMRKTWQAEIAVPWYRAAFIEPAAQQAKLFPVAEGYLSFHHQMEPSWSLAETEEAAEHRTDGAVTPMQIRLEALRHVDGPAAVFDSRPAASLFTGLQRLEEKVARKELELPATQQFRRLEVDEYAESVLLPLMREDLDRNHHLLESKTAEDLPELVSRTVELAETFAPRPLLLLDPAQRRVMVPDLLSSFLVVQLIDRGWTPEFSFWDGFRLSTGGTGLDPAKIVRELGDGELDADDFLALIGAGLNANGAGS